MAKQRQKNKVIGVPGEGKEPVIPGEVDKLQIVDTLNWYSYFWEKKKSIKALVEYLKDKGEKEKAKAVRNVNDNLIMPTYGNLAQMIRNGSIIPNEYQEKLNKHIDMLVERYGFQKIEEDKQKEKDDKQPQLTVQDHIQNRANEIAGEIDVYIDDFLKNDCKGELNTYEFLAKKEAKPVHASKIADEFRPLLEELNEAKIDTQLKEAYEHLGTRKLNRLIKFVESIIDDCDNYASNKKKTRSAKKKKPRARSVTKQIEKLQYKSEDIELKLASVPPEKIIGAQQLWTYNTKYKKLTVYNAMNRDGFGIKGTTLQNFDPDTSEAKSVRKPSETVKRVLDGGKIVLRKLMSELTTKSQEAKGRINKDTILLRVE